MAKYEPIRLDNKIFQNVDEASLTRANAALENGFINETGGQTRFPGIDTFVNLPDDGKIYLNQWHGDLIAATAVGRVYRVRQDGTTQDVTGVPLQGGKRPTFSRTEDELMMAAGGPILRLAEEQTEVLSDQAPNTTHIGYIDSYAVAIEPFSGRCFFSDPGQTRVWPALNVLTANAKPDAVTALFITDFREMLLAGEESVEQYEPFASGDSPFYRRWTTGETLKAPYTMVSADNATWHLNVQKEFIRISGQASQPRSEDIQLVLEGVDNWAEAWAERIHIAGQKFIVLAMPNAANPHGTTGLTLLYDYRQDRWYGLYGWDDALGVPARWPAWSYEEIWDRHFVGCDGMIGELKRSTRTIFGQVQRMHYRSAHISEWGEARIDNLRIRLKRGGTLNQTTEPQISVRVLKDNRRWTRWVRRGLGTSGERHMELQFGSFGAATTFQLEYFVTDAAEVEIVHIDALVERLGR